nr:osmotin-like protein [Ipomoea batatas]
MLLLLLTLLTSTSAVNFEVHNNCPYTVWAAATPVGGGQRLDNGQSWNINVPPGTKMARCTGWGKPPNTLAEFALNQFNNLDFFDISNVDGFNIPMSFGPTRPGPDKCHQTRCPDAYSYPQDDATSTFTCPGGSTDYKVVFCP